MLDRLRVYQGADQIELFGPALPNGLFRRALAAIRNWINARNA